uniref:RRM domain-containing protein n=1 Tax=Steinernema glaseri TaxID=37863 RepID=A0A1I7YCK5_9BILA
MFIPEMSADYSNTDFYTREEMAMLAELAADGSFQGQRMPRIFRHAAMQLQNSLERPMSGAEPRSERNWTYPAPAIDFGRSGRKRRYEDDPVDYYDPPRREPLIPSFDRSRGRARNGPPPRRNDWEAPTPYDPYQPELVPMPPSRATPPAFARSKPHGDRDFDSSESAGSGKHMNSVLMVYGIDQSRFNCDKLFNLFCVYGTCLRIKFLKAKPDTCMVEMGLPSESALIIEHLNGIELFGHKLLFQPSKQKTITSVEEPFKMPDQTLSFVDYSNNKNQRFSDVRAARKNRILPPSRQLYWFDAPPGITEHGIQKIFEMKRASTPVAVTKFNIKTEKVAVGTCDFSSVEAATEALMLCNHAKVQLSQKSDTFVLKLAYSGSFETSRSFRA